MVSAPALLQDTARCAGGAGPHGTALPAALCPPGRLCQRAALGHGRADLGTRGLRQERHSCHHQRHGTAQLGSAQLGSEQLSTAWLIMARHSSAQLGMARVTKSQHSLA